MEIASICSLKMNFRFWCFTITIFETVAIRHWRYNKNGSVTSKILLLTTAFFFTHEDTRDFSYEPQQIYEYKMLDKSQRFKTYFCTFFTYTTFENL